MAFTGFSPEELKEFKERSTKGGSLEFSLGEGRTKIRLFVSPAEKSPSPFYEVHSHWYVGTDGKKHPIICTERTKSINKPCPICALVSKMYASDNADVVELAKQVRAGRRFNQWAFVQAPNDTNFREKPAILSLPKNIVMQILDIINGGAEEFVDIFSAKDGYPITISRQKGDGAMQYITTVIPSRSPMSLLADPFKEAYEGTKGIMDTLRIPDEAMQAQAVEAIEAMLSSPMGAKEEEAPKGGKADIAESAARFLGDSDED